MRAALLAWVGGICAVVGAHAQAIDPSETRVRLGEPLDLQLRVRHAQASLSALAPHCVRATVVMGGTLVEPDDWTVHVRPDSRAGWERVRLTHSQQVTEPIVEVQFVLRCGAEFSRAFSVLADPPTPGRHAIVKGPEARRLSDSVPVSERRPIGLIPAAEPVPAALPESVPAFMPASVPVREQEASSRGSSAMLLDELARLRDEQRRTLTELTSLQARMAHRDRIWWPEAVPAWALPTLGLTLLLVLWRRLGPRSGRGWRTAKPKGPALSSIDVPASVAPHGSILRSGEPVAFPQTPSMSPIAQAAERRARWVNADFGEPTLEGAPLPEALREVERYAADGYAIASVTLMERALHAQPGKNPWHLVALLDLYGLLGQRGQQECVAAQLEALYNARAPEVDGSIDEGRELLDQPASLAAVLACWRGLHRQRDLAALLLQPVAVEPLDLAAFRDVLLLHAMACQMAEEDRRDEEPPFDPLIDWSPET